MVILLGGKFGKLRQKEVPIFIYLFKSTGKGRSFLIPIVMCIFCLFLNEDLVSCLFITRVFWFGFALFVFQMCEVVFFPQLPGAQRSLGSVGED